VDFMLARALPRIAILLALGPAATAERVVAPPGHGSYQLYCASCHGAGAEGGGVAALGARWGPPLTALGGKYGAPLRRERLAELVVSERRPGGQRVCGDRVFAKLPDMPFRSAAELATVLTALEYVAAVQRSPDE
jgi:hypothetical protein